MAYSNMRSTGLRTEQTSSWPSPAQDYYEGPLSLDRELNTQAPSTFLMHVISDAMASTGIRSGDKVIVDRSIQARPGLLVVVTIAAERRLGIFATRDGHAVLVTDHEVLPLTDVAEYFGTVTASISRRMRSTDVSSAQAVVQ